MKIGILTSDGDCPVLSAVISGAVPQGIAIDGDEFVWLFDGWRRVVEGGCHHLLMESTRLLINPLIRGTHVRKQRVRCP
ncbi:hypothetical protein DFO47_11220 [Arthrobacter sp. AG258]|nr:hypothetical protein DFO47_11220 [Arthrobacter sp. AG258]